MDEHAGARADAGRQLFLMILARYPNLSTFYRDPDLVDSLTTAPKAMLSVPIDDWNALTVTERDALAAYAASLVTVVCNNPLHYARVADHAPTAPQIRIHTAGMTETSWQIMAGALTSDGRTITMGEIVSAGTSARCG